MHFVYVTTDEVQQSDGRKWSADCGIDLSVRPDLDFCNGILIDLDSLTPPQRRQAVERLTGRLVIAVHSYGLTDDQITALQEKGVRVFQRLEQDVFAQLATVARSTETAPPPAAAVIPFKPPKAFTKDAISKGTS